ncbi:MAG: hypothetical protein RLZZ500_114 [Bacteroidota bacterium]|jgi:ferric-dicitrate binding protein FerR (iron transport regulator)
MKMEDTNRLAAWLNNELPEAELNTLRQEEDYAVLEKIKKYSAELQVTDFDTDNLFQSILDKREGAKVRPLYWKKALQIAAVVTLFLGVGFTYLFLQDQEQIAVNGSTVTFNLPDQSKVMLHSGSEITYSERDWDNNRTLNLNGEAYFKVAKGKKFEVNTQEGTVTVLGTQFNVKARNNRIDVTCYEGKVKIQHQNKSIIITKGQTIAFANNNLIINHPTTALYPSWISKELQFEKVHPQDVLEELERHFNITINDIKLPSSELFTGHLPGDNPEIALQLFAASYHLKVKKQEAQENSFELIP